MSDDSIRHVKADSDWHNVASIRVRRENGIVLTTVKFYTEPEELSDSEWGDLRHKVERATRRLTTPDTPAHPNPQEESDG